MHLLVAETDTLFCDNLARHLRQRGLFVQIATNMSSLAEILHDQAFEVALVGFVGAQSNALGMLEVIRAVHPNTRVILMTPPDCIRYSIEGMQLGAFDDIQVPFDIDLLYEKIMKALALHFIKTQKK